MPKARRHGVGGGSVVKFIIIDRHAGFAKTRVLLFALHAKVRFATPPPVAPCFRRKFIHGGGKARIAAFSHGVGHLINTKGRAG